MPKVATSIASTRARVGLPIVPDGTHERPLLLRLPDPSDGACNNGCRECLTRPIGDDHARFDGEVRGRHVVIRHREAILDPDLRDRVVELRRRGAESVTLVTNGRMLVYEKVAARLVRAGVSRFVVKLFGVDADEHDAYTRCDESFAQATEGISTVRKLGAEALVAFPRVATSAEATSARRSLARALTDRDPIDLPEPRVSSHPSEFRYDVVVLRDAPTHHLWTDSFFPMAHVNTGPACNIRCTYCNVHGGDDQRLYAADYVESLIEHAARRVLHGDGHSARPTIDLIGGEPTLHPELPRLIATAKRVGFRDVSICTNGVLLRKPGYLDKLIKAGLTIVRFSFHEHRADRANALADVSGLGTSYPEVAKMLLARRDVHTHVYRIILASTLDALDDYVDFLAEHNLTGKPVDLTFGMPSMRGRLFENQHLYPPLEGLRERIARAIERARSLGIDPIIHHAPACLVPDEPERAACLHVTMVQYDSVSDRAEVMNFEGDARYGMACARCDGRDRGCHGLPAPYFEADPERAEAWLRPVRSDATRVVLPAAQARDRRASC